MSMVAEGQVLPVHATADPARTRTPNPADDQRQLNFKVAVIGEYDFQAATGHPASELPEGQLVDGSAYSFSSPGAGSPGVIAPGAGIGTQLTRYPFPNNTTGVLWTGDHMADVAVVDGAATVRGFRAPLGLHLMSAAERRLGVFGGSAGDATYILNSGTPGTYAWDYPYLYSPGARLVHQGSVNQSVAESGAATIDAAIDSYDTIYRHSPPPPGNPAYERLSGGNPNYVCQPGVNCINGPLAEHTTMLGGRSMTINPDRPVDIATGNEVSTGEPFEFAAEGGRAYSGPGYARNADTWASAVEDRAAEGLTSTPIFAGMVVRGVLRDGGKVLLIYGIYESVKRIYEAPGEELPAVVFQEGSTWLGGWVGSTLTAAAAGAVVCSETGPGAVICSAAFGIVGGIAGAIFGRNVSQEVIDSLAGVGDLLRNPVELANTATLMFGTPAEKRIMWQWQREEREANGQDPDDF